MRRKRFYDLAISIFAFPIIAWSAVLVHYYYAIQGLKSNIYFSLLYERFVVAATNPLINSFIGLILIEIVVYWLIRKKLNYSPWIFLHVVMNLTTFFIFPLYAGLLDLNPFNDQYKSIPTLQLKLFFWVPFILGHIIFLLTIAISFKKKTAGITNESTGLLDEFINRT